jgi:hypothetical protein
MDLRSAGKQDATIDRLTRAGMVICFLATGTLLISALSIDAHEGIAGTNFALNPTAPLR